MARHCEFEAHARVEPGTIYRKTIGILRIAGGALTALSLSVLTTSPSSRLEAGRHVDKSSRSLRPWLLRLHRMTAERTRAPRKFSRRAISQNLSTPDKKYFAFAVGQIKAMTPPFTDKRGGSDRSVRCGGCGGR